MTVENLELNVKTNAGTAAKQFDSLSKALDRVSKSAKAAQVRTSLGFKNVSTAAQKATKSTNTFMSSLMRIAKYRLFRSMIKAITDAFSEGLQNAYAFSDAIVSEGHRFSTALDSMSSAGLKMKNQLGSALIALLTLVEPIITTIINLITRVADAMSQLFAVFTGGTYLKAIDAPKKWADAAGGAAKKAKEWKNQLLGFDEINRLEEPSNNNGGGGSDATDFMSMFEDTPISGIFAKIKEKVDELKESLNFEPLRQAWDRLKESVSNLADTILKGLGWAWENVLVPLSHWTIEELAPRLVTALANAFELLNSILLRLAPYFDWFYQNVLKPCFTFIGNVVIKVLDKFNALLSDLNDWVNGKISFAEFIDGLNFTQEVILALSAALGIAGLFGVFTKIVAIVGTLGSALIAFVTNPVTLVISGIAAAILIGIELYKHWDDIIAKVKEFQQTLSNALNDGKLNWLDFVAVFVSTIMAPIEAIVALINWLITLCNWIKSAIEGLNRLDFVKKANNRASQAEEDGSIYLQGFASGGFPAEGQLFIANEPWAGPELVGTLGGRTAVASNSDILEGIRQGVYDAVVAANGNGEREVNVRVYLDSREIKIGQDRYNRAMGVV